MQLKKIILEVLREQEDAENIIEFPNENFTVSINRNEKKLVFAPLLHSAIPSKIRTYINLLKQNFRVLRVNSLEDEDDTRENDVDDPKLRGVFEIEFDPREDFEAVLDFIRNQIDRERE